MAVARNSGIQSQRWHFEPNEIALLSRESDKCLSIRRVHIIVCAYWELYNYKIKLYNYIKIYAWDVASALIIENTKSRKVRLRNRYDDISQNSRLCPKLSNFPQNVFIRNKSIIWHSINNRTSTSPNSAIRLSCRIAECEVSAWNMLLPYHECKKKKKRKKFPEFRWRNYGLI